jgi:predicted RNA methylase
VVVVVFVLVVDVTETRVEIKVVAIVVEIDPVDTTVDVEVVVMSPPNGANCRIVDSAFVEIVDGSSFVKPGLEPTIHPPLGEVMYTELKTGGICPRIAGEVVI